MTRRSKLDDIYPDPIVEIHSRDAENLKIETGERIKVRSRRSEITVKTLINQPSPTGTVFIPFHFAGAAANEITLDARDPRVKIPDYKVCAVTVEKAKD